MCDVWRRAQRRPAAMDERPGGGLRDDECFGYLVITVCINILLSLSSLLLLLLLLLLLSLLLLLL